MKALAAPSVILRGLGAFAPAQVVTNEDLSRRVETTDEWIVSRTGIRERRLAGPGETPASMGAAAAAQALERAGLAPGDVDLLILATLSPDLPFPSTAALVQARLGLRHIPAFDVAAACSGFLYALETAAALLRQGPYRTALVIGAEKMSGTLDWSDRSTCVLFGDGAGAAVLTVSPEPGVGVQPAVLYADGTGAPLLCQPAGGSALPTTAETLAAGQNFLHMNGKEVFKVAVKGMEQAARETLARHGLEPSDVDWVIPHQANQRIIANLAERLGLPPAKLVGNLERYGNTSAASIPLVLEEAWREGRFHRGDKLLLLSFGAGLTWGGQLVVWHA